MSLKKETPLDIQLHKGAINGDQLLIKKVLSTGRVWVDCPDEEGTTALMLATACCNYNCVEELLTCWDANPNSCRIETGSTPLFLAAQNGDLKTLRLLLKHGAKVDKPNFDGGTPLFVACQEGHESVVRELLNLGANPNSFLEKDRASAIFIASQQGQTIILQLLIGKGGRVDTKRIDGVTPLWIGAFLGWADCCRTLLENGANVNTIRMDGCSVLYKASQKGFYDVVRVLLKWRPFLGLLPNGESSLHGGASFGHLSIVKILIKAGSDPKLRNGEGETPYDLAVKNKFDHVAEYLEAKIFQKESSSSSSHHHLQHPTLPHTHTKMFANGLENIPNGSSPSASTS